MYTHFPVAPPLKVASQWHWCALDGVASVTRDAVLTITLPKKLVCSREHQCARMASCMETVKNNSHHRLNSEHGGLEASVEWNSSSVHMTMLQYKPLHWMILPSMCNVCLGCVYSITCKSIVKVHAIVQNYLYCKISIPDFKQLKACDPTPQSHTTVCQCPHHSLQACQASGNGETYPAW